MPEITRIHMSKRTGDFKFQASPPGVDVFSITDEGEFVFNSDWDKTGIIHEVGFKSGFDVKVADASNAPEQWGSTILFPELPYRPHIILGRYDATQIFWREFTRYSANGERWAISPYYIGTTFRDGFFMFGFPSIIDGPQNFVYIVFKLPIPGL